MKLNTIVAIAAISMLASCSSREKEYVKFGGFAQGSSYSISYRDAKLRNLHHQIDSILDDFDSSLSIYNEKSIISRMNNNDTSATADRYFTECFSYSAEVSKATGGAFDITVGPLVRAWGFGLKKKDKITQEHIDSLLKLVGMDKVALVKGKLRKKDPKIFIDVNAIAQGYSVDVVARYLESKGISEYLIEIGGETFGKGLNSHGKPWTIGIDKPEDGNMAPGENLQARVGLPSGKALATSGNYRKFYVENGVKYSHEIDPKTGYPARNTLLSASVVAKNCTYADAFATAFMVFGVDKTKEFLKSHPEMDAYLVFSGKNGAFETYATPGFEKMLLKE
jgi:Membrane-associated lipoprotein involved in thiamine biosynthesis